ncbi:hypothetical protein D3C80_1134670 [compost metagenome]
MHQLVLALHPHRLRAQNGRLTGDLRPELLPLPLPLQAGLTGLLPLGPTITLGPLAPGLGPHLLIEPCLPLCQALAQAALLLGQALQLGLPLRLLSLALVPLLLELLLTDIELGQLLPQPHQHLLPCLGLRQLPLPLGQTLCQRLPLCQQAGL